MVSCLNPPVRSAGRQQIWTAYRERARKLDTADTNPLLWKYLGLVAVQEQVDRKLHETLDIPHASPDCSLLSYFNAMALRAALIEAANSLTVRLTFAESETLTLLENLWNQVEEFEYPRDLILRLVLEVFATGVSLLPHRLMETQSDHCPHCGFSVLCLILREEGLGRKRFGHCSLCSSEWDTPRLGCLRCGEQRADNLPVFTFEGWSHIQVNACDSCGGYLKTIDLTKDVAALPMPDDVWSSALNVWAFERGYESIGNHFFDL